MPDDWPKDNSLDGLALDESGVLHLPVGGQGADVDLENVGVSAFAIFEGLNV